MVRFVIYYNPELPDPAFAKIVVITPEAKARDRLKWRLRAEVEKGLAPEALVRVNQLVFGPPVPYPVAFRFGPGATILRGIANQCSRSAECKSTRLDAERSPCHDAGA